MRDYASEYAAALRTAQPTRHEAAQYAYERGGVHSAYVQLGILLVWGHGKTSAEALESARRAAAATEKAMAKNPNLDAFEAAKLVR